MTPPRWGPARGGDQRARGTPAVSWREAVARRRRSEGAGGRGEGLSRHLLPPPPRGPLLPPEEGLLPGPLGQGLGQGTSKTFRV